MISAGGLGLTSKFVLPLPKGTRVYRDVGGSLFYLTGADTRPFLTGIPAPGWSTILARTGNFQPDRTAREVQVHVNVPATNKEPV